MKLLRKIGLVFAVAVILFLCSSWVPSEIVKATAGYEAVITVTDTSGTARTAVPVSVAFNSTGAISLGMLDAAGLYIRVFDGTSELPCMLASDRLQFLLSSLSAYQSKAIRFQTSYTPALAKFSIIPGYGGYSTTAYNSALLPGADFTLAVNNGIAIDGVAGAGKNIMTMEPAVTGTTYPVIASQSGGFDATGTSHTINMPAGVVSGDLILFAFRIYKTPTLPVTTTPAGWTLSSTTDYGTTSRMLTYHKISNGSEGASITIATDSNCISSHISLRITGSSGTVTAGTGVGAATTTPNPPSVTNASGADTNLFIAIVGYDYGGYTITANPTGYTGLTGYGDATSTGIDGAYLGCGHATEDPGTFTLSNNNGTNVNTFTVSPKAVYGLRVNQGITTANSLSASIYTGNNAGCTNLNGSTQYWHKDASVTMPSGDIVSFQGWYYPTSWTGAYEFLGGAGVPNQSVGVYTLNGAISTAIGESAGFNWAGNFVTTSAPLILNQWNLVTVTYNASATPKSTCMVNGASVAGVEYGVGGAIDSPNTFASVGSQYSGAVWQYFFAGSTDDFCVYNDVVTLAEHQTTWNNYDKTGIGNPPVVDANLISRWQYGEGSGTIAYDSKGANDLAGVGSPTWVTTSPVRNACTSVIDTSATAGIYSGYTLSLSGGTLSGTLGAHAAVTSACATNLSNTNSATLVLGSSAVAMTDNVTYAVGATTQLIYLPTALISGTTLLNSGVLGATGNAVITWGANSGLTVTSTGLKAVTEYLPGSSVVGVPTVIVKPATLPGESTPEDVTLPWYTLFQPAAVALGWITMNLYAVLAIFGAMAFGVGVGVATGSTLLAMVGLGFALVVGAGMSVVGWWVVVVYAIFGITFIGITKSV